MVAIKKDNLEKALDEQKNPEVSKEMEIGFHQGTLNTLVNERNELVKMIQQIEQIMRVHMQRLEELGVKIKTSDKK